MVVLSTPPDPILISIEENLSPPHAPLEASLVALETMF